MEERKTVSLCMIVKNEERYLAQCLESVKEIVDEMIIVDTGSIDKTIDIAKDYNAKVIYHKWKNDFSEARNVSLSYATMDWILIMDGDDIFEAKDINKFKELINSYQNDIALFNTASLTGTKGNEATVYNMNIRLIRNNKKYKYYGAIHEQICSVEEELDWTKVANVEITIHHFGYLNQVTIEKDKRNRNISILKNELEINPDSAFHLFNLGNEYFALGDFNKALEVYEKSYSKVTGTNGFVPKLLLRLVETLIMIGESKKALNTINEGLSKFPEYIDLIYFKAIIYNKKGMYTKSIKSLNQCLEKGDSPPYLRYLDGTGTYRALEYIGDNFLEMKDYNEAINAYIECYRLRPQNDSYLVKIINAIKSANDFQQEDETIKVIKYLGDLTRGNEIKLMQLLLDKGIFEEYDELEETLKDDVKKSDEYLLLKAKRLFYDKKYIDSLGYFSYVEEKLNNYEETAIFKTLIFLFTAPKTIINYIARINITEAKKDVLLSCYNIISNVDIKDFDSKYNVAEVLNITMDILKQTLLLKEFDIFEKFLELLNHIIDNGVLIRLAKLYDEFGFEKMAAQEVFRSIKAFNIIDTECISILKRGI